MLVPATDDPPTLERCLTAVHRARPTEVLVQHRPRGAGPAAARNLAARRTSADVIVFVDADVEIHPDAVDRVRTAFARDGGLTAVFGCYDDRPYARGIVSRFRNLLHHHIHASSPGPAETFWAGLGAIRREAFLAAGGFDAARFPTPAIEDIELGARLRRAGARIQLDPDIRGTHLKRWSLGGMIRTDVVRRGVPWVRLQLEARSLSGALNLAPRHRLSALACVLAAGSLAARRPRAATGFVALLVALNARFYELLARRGGPGLAVAAVPLHVLHHLLAVASLPLGLVAHVASRRGAGSTEAPS